MKSFYTLCTFLSLTTIGLVAQPVITSDITPNIGDAWTGFFLQVNTMDYPSNIAGANATWDFSGLADSLDGTPEEFIEAIKADPFFTFTIIPTGDALRSENFPDADFAVRTFIDFFTIADNYEFIDEQNNGLFGLGDVSATEFEFFGMVFGDTTITINAEPEIFFPFPNTFGDSFISTSTLNEEDENTGTRTESVTRDSTVADSYGKLITPFGTSDNVLRWATYSTTTATTTLIANGQVTSSTTTSSLSYQWFNTNQLAPILTYELPDMNDDEELGTLIFYVQTSGVSSTKNLLRRDNLALTVAPNPAKDKIQIQFDLERPAKQVTAALYDLQGRLVSYHPWGTLAAGEQNPTFQFPYKLPGGTYILRVLGEGLLGHQKVVVRR